MSKANKLYLIGCLSQLGLKLTSPDDALLDIIQNEHHHNAWFTPENTTNAVKAIGAMLNEADLATWLGGLMSEVRDQIETDQTSDLRPLSPLRVEPFGLFKIEFSAGFAYAIDGKFINQFIKGKYFLI